MLLRSLILYLSLFLSAALSAQTVSPDNALCKAKEFFGTHADLHSKASAASAPSLAFTASRDGETYYYAFNDADGDGFVLIGGDEKARQILGYSEHGTFSYDRLPDNLRWWLAQYETQISTAIRSDANGNERNTTTATESVKASIAPLVTTRWSQDTPFNLAILGGTTTSYPVGCVATAIAQIMKRWEHPSQGADHTFAPLKLDDMTTAVACNTNITYRWDLMQDEYNDFNTYSEPESKAVADLMYRLGRSFNMKYSEYGSGTSSSWAGYGLATNFFYDKSMRIENHSCYTNADWETLIYNELHTGRPILYIGSSLKEGGHAFVCDGYDAALGGYHINWGWGGYCDGYFPLTGTGALLPYNYTTDEEFAFSHSQEILCNIKPDEGGEYDHRILSDAKSSLNKSTAKKGEYVFFSTTCYMESIAPFNLQFGVELVDDASGKSTFIKSYYSAFETELGVFYLPSVPFYIDKTYTPGTTYSVYLAYSVNDGPLKRADIPLGLVAPRLTIGGTTAIEQPFGATNNKKSLKYNTCGQRINSASPTLPPIKKGKNNTVIKL